MDATKALSPLPEADWRPNTEGMFTLSADAYHKAPGLSQSMLKLAYRSPSHVRQAQLMPKEPTEDMRLGTLIDLALTEPMCFDNALYVQPETYGPDKKPWHNGANECKEWVKAHSGRTIITTAEMKQIEDMQKQFLGDEWGWQFHTRAIKQAAVFVRDEETGLLLKGRYDFILPHDEETIVADLKKISRDENGDFAQTAGRFLYPLQADFYTMLLERHLERMMDHPPRVHFLNGTILDVRPHLVSWFEPCVNDMALCRSIWKKGLRNYAEAEQTGVFAKIVPFHLPNWTIKQYE